MYILSTLLLLLALILLFIFMGKVNRLEKKFRRLELEFMKIMLQREPSGAPTPAQQDEAVQTPAQAEEAPHEKKVEPEVPQTATITAPQVRPVPTPRPSRSREEWESFIGGKLLNRIGAVALIFGVAFFLKYAFDKNWINEYFRVSIGLATGAALIFGGMKFHRKNFQIFAQGLLGAGIAVLYLSVYSSFNFYHLVAQLPAILMMSAITGLTIFLGLKYNSLAITLLGWAGGFLTPFLLSTGHANEIGLFTYVAILDVGLIMLAMSKKEWRIIVPLSLAGTYFTFTAWYANYYGNSDFVATVFFLVLFLMLFLGEEYYHLLKTVRTTDLSSHITYSLGYAVNYLFFYIVFEESKDYWTAPATLLLSGVYFATYFVSRMKTPEDYRLQNRYLITALSLATISALVQFGDFEVVMALAIGALLLVIVGLKSRLPIFWQAGLAVFAIAMHQWFFNESTWYTNPDKFTLILNMRLLSELIFSGALFTAALFFRREDAAKFRTISEVLNYAWIFILLLLINTELFDQFRVLRSNAESYLISILNYRQTLLMTALMAVYAVPLFLVGMKQKTYSYIISSSAITALSLIIAAVNAFLYVPFEEFVPVINWRFAAILVIGVILFIFMKNAKVSAGEYSWALNHSKFSWISILALGLILLSVEISDLFRRLIYEAGLEASWRITLLGNMKQFLLSGSWLLYSIILMAWGLIRRNRLARVISMIISGIAILKVFIYDLSFLETLYRVFSFIALGVILLIVSYLYQRYKDVIMAKD